MVHFYDFNEPIFTGQFCSQKFIQIYQIFTKLWHSVPIKNLKGLSCSEEQISSNQNLAFDGPTEIRSQSVLRKPLS